MFTPGSAADDEKTAAFCCIWLFCSESEAELFTSTAIVDLK
jgi:hypothetical protein